MGLKILQPDGTYCYSGVECRKHGKYNQTVYVKTHNKSEFLEVHKKYVYQLVDYKKRPQYVDSINNKHFKPGGHGSKFTDPNIKNVNELLLLAAIQRGDLNGDDRGKLIKLGASTESFLPVETGVRYLKVDVEGIEALADTKFMEEGERLTIRAKGKNDGRLPSLSFVAENKEVIPVNYGTIIIGSKETIYGDPIPGTETLWTAFPGVATLGVTSEEIREKGWDDGTVITVQQFRETFGRDIKVNISH